MYGNYNNNNFCDDDDDDIDMCDDYSSSTTTSSSSSSYRKRTRPYEFLKNEVDDKDIDEILSFETSLKHPESLNPFSETLTQLPGFNKEARNLYGNGNGGYGGHRSFVQDIDSLKKHKFNQNKEEIRQIMRLNAKTKEMSKRQEEQINNIGILKYNPSIFIEGYVSEKPERILHY